MRYLKGKAGRIILKFRIKTSVFKLKNDKENGLEKFLQSKKL